MKGLTISILLTVLASSFVYGDNTIRRGRLRVGSPELLRGDDGIHAGTDTIQSPPGGLVILSGYDKPLSSMRESMLVTNRHTSAVTGMVIEINYLDMSGNELDQATVEINLYIPPGATRKATFKSWDSQRSYYYHLGKTPRTANVTPYDVRCRILRLIITKNE